MATRKPNAVHCMPCPQEIDQLFRIFRALGTPNEALWPGVTRLPDYKSVFPQWRPRPVAELVPTLEQAGVDLLARMLAYQPEARITAVEALQHPYFADVRVD